MIETKTTITQTCDRCKKEVREIGTVYLEAPSRPDVPGGFWGRRHQQANISDLCDGCWEELMIFFGKEPGWWKRLLRPWLFEKKESE